MGVSIDDIFTALQVFQGSEQINDFNKFGRSYKVTVQADKEFRGNIDSLKYIFVKSSNDVMVPLNTLLTYKKIFAPTSISRYNGVRAVQINGTAASGYSSGQVMEALEKTAAEVLPDGYTYSWSGQSREEKISNGQAPVLFGLAFLFMFLCLAALYESWSIPLAVLLSVPTGVFGAFLFQYVRGLENSIYMQIGLVMLIGLTAKNAILIVEFAKVRMEAGMSICEAAVQAALIRLRPILMTSIAFILGCIPLAFASGAGAGARNSMGNAVVGGMLAATVLEIFVVPALFVMIETLREKYTFPGKKEKDR
jgi:multidrug efflux pump subunit AcrB